MLFSSSPLLLMLLYFFISLTLFFTHGFPEPELHVGHNLTMAVPVEYTKRFIGTAIVMETNQSMPSFQAKLSVEAYDNGKKYYSCSFQVFLGDIKVWSSGHYSRFYTLNVCVLELRSDGDLRLKGPKDRVGWRTGTSGQGVQRLELLKNGNLVLVDGFGRIKWQSFNFPTDVLLSGQRLSVASRLTSFPSNTSSYYSMEIEHSKIALYLNTGMRNYSYWEFKPTKNRSIAFVQWGPKGLELYSYKGKKIAQINPTVETIEPLRFLALGNETGNLKLYFYSPSLEKFDASFQALNTTCDLPLACKPYGICTASNSCSCIQLSPSKNATTNMTSTTTSGCIEGVSLDLYCGKGKGEMLDLDSVTSVLKGDAKFVNVSKEECGKKCLGDCKCASALYENEECFLYGMVIGVKQVERGREMSYMVKVPKGFGHGGHGKSNVKKWMLILVGVVDGGIILVLCGGFGYYLVRKRRRHSLPTDHNN